jgi:lysophospholipase L1-like esterase
MLIRSLLVAAAAAGLIGSGPGASTATAPVRVDVLGDSYAAGYGVLPSTDCGRSSSSYGVLVDGRAGLVLDDLVACPRESSTSMVETGQLDALDAGTDLVLLSVAANDVEWSKPAVACLLRSNAECADATATLTARISTELPTLLDQLHDKIAAAAPDAGVIVTGYPRLFTPRYGAMLNASPIEQKRVNDATDRLTAEMRAAADRHGFAFVDVTPRFAGHGMNAPDWWIYPLRDEAGAIDRRAFHPTATGYDAYASAIIVTYRLRA